MTLTHQLWADRVDAFDGQLRTALETLEATRGRAAVDNRGIGAAKFLVQRTLESLARLRADIRASVDAEELDEPYPDSFMNSTNV